MFWIFFDGYYDKTFRTMQDNLSDTQGVDLRGLRELRASGGTSIRISNLAQKLKHVTGPKVIVDGIQEYHGYVNGFPTMFLGYHVDSAGYRHLPRRIIITGTFEKRPDLVVSEDVEAKKYGFDYKRFEVSSRSYPSNKDVDEIVHFFEALPKDAWIHFHCHHGTGRTSVMLAMFDILKNAPLVSLEDIIKRQHLLGSSNLFDTTKWTFGTYKQEQLVNRKNFIENFYAFIVQRKKGGIPKWSEWIKQHRSRVT